MNKPDLIGIIKQGTVTTWDMFRWWVFAVLMGAGLFASYSYGTGQTWYEHDQVENHCVDGHTDWQIGHDFWGRAKVE